LRIFTKKLLCSIGTTWGDGTTSNIVIDSHRGLSITMLNHWNLSLSPFVASSDFSLLSVSIEIDDAI
jgi:hypothetical protein